MTKQERIEMIAAGIIGGLVGSAPSWFEAVSNMSDDNMKRALDRAEAMVDMSDKRCGPKKLEAPKHMGSANRLAEIDELIHASKKDSIDGIPHRFIGEE